DIFRFQLGSWQVTQTFDGPRISGDQFFGDSLSLNGNRLAVGLPGRETRRGAVRIYRADALGTWTPGDEGFVFPAELPLISFFGNSVALTNTSMIVGSDRTDVPATNAGSAWAYTFCDCPADTNGDDNANFFDVVEFIRLYNEGRPEADLAEPFGVFNFFDIAAYIGLFNAGCP
ncbi:MAG: GC-type dockerin domain-anchored protein, partial [Phycisphaeraceae bacterium]